VFIFGLFPVLDEPPSLVPVAEFFLVLLTDGFGLVISLAACDLPFAIPCNYKAVIVPKDCPYLVN